MKCAVDIANNGKESIEMMKANPGKYDLVFMDLLMPVMGGIEAAKKIRRHVDKKIPIIAFTAAVMGNEKVDSLDAGMNDFMVKPIDPKVLRHKMAHWTNIKNVS